MTISTTSFSRLEVWAECPRKYRLRYIDRLPATAELNEHVLLGTLVHGALQEWLDPKTPTQDPGEAFALYFPTWLREVELSEDLVEDLLDFVRPYADLLLRASPSYCGADAIRNRDGSPPKDLEAFPPGAWTAALRSANLSQRKLELDNRAGVESEFFRHISATHLVGRAYFMVVYFRIPAWVKRTLWVERGISVPGKEGVVDSVLFPGRDDLYAQGYLDWVVETEDGRIAVLDHKTNKATPTELEVRFHPQLNWYAWLLYKATGIFPDLVGISHLPTHTFVVTEVEPEIVRDVVNHLVEIQEAIDQGKFPRRLPTVYNSPCIKRDYRTQAIKEVCPYLAHCWPSYAEQLSCEG